MSNDIYNILKNFNKVAQDTPKPAEKKVKPKSKLQEQFEQFKEKSTLNESTVSEVAPPAMRQAGRAAGQVLGAGIGAALTGLPAALIGGLALGPGGAIGAGAAAGLPGAKAGVDVGGYEGQRAANVAYDKIVNLWRRASAALGGPEATAEFIRAHAKAAKQGLDKFNFNDEVYAVTMNPMQANKAMQELSSLQESVGGLLSEKYMGFKKTVAAIKKGGSADNPQAVAAAIGRKKYGKEKFQQAAARGKKLGESQQGVAEGMERGEYSRVLGALGLYYPRLSMEELNVPEYHKVIANKANVPVEYAAQVINDFVRATEPEDEDWMQDDEQGVAEAAAQYTKDEIISILSGDKTQAQVDAERKAQQPTAQPATTQPPGTKTNEVAPPGAKAERMVKHIKKGYAKDGKLSDKERSIAYATAWKAHKAGKVEEAVAALSVLARSGMTAQQITEGWEDMMKAVAQRAKDEQGTGKFDKKKDPVTGGTVYSRKYNPKTGEVDDTENVTAVKRGRGRPKKSAFEQYMQKYETMLEDADPLGKFIKGLDQSKQSQTSTNNTSQPARPVKQDPVYMGTIKGGVWSADPPKKGEKGVPMPQSIDEAGAGPTNAAALGRDPTNPLNNPMGGYQAFRPAPTKPAPAATATQSQQSGGAAFGIYPKAFPNRTGAKTIPNFTVPDKFPKTITTAADFQRTDKDTTQVPMPVRPGDGLDASGRRTAATDPRVIKPAATKPARPKPAPQRVATTYTGPEGDAKLPGSTQGERDDAAATDLANQPTSSAKEKPPAVVPVKPAGIPVQSGTPGINWKDSAGQPVTSRSADEIGDTDAYTGEYKPGSYDRRMQQGQKNLDAIKNFFGIGKEKAAPAAKPAEPAATNFQPTDSQTVAESDRELEEMMRLAGMGEALKGGQKKLDKNKNGKLDADDFARLRGEVDEDFALLVPPPAAAKSADQAKAIGALKPAEPGKPDPFAKGAVAIPLSDLPKREIGGMEEGNEFSGALDAARDAGKREFKVGDKTYPVKEADDSNEGYFAKSDYLDNVYRMLQDDGTEPDVKRFIDWARDAGAYSMEDAIDLGTKVDWDQSSIHREYPRAYQGWERAIEITGYDPYTKPDIFIKEEKCMECGMYECGCDAGHEESHEGHMNVSMNADSDGNQSMTVSADGENAVKLAQLLKLAGLGSGQPEAVYHPVEVVVGDGEEIEEEKDPRYHASTTPDEEVFGVDTQIKGGNGDVAGQEKTMRKHGYQFGDNPIAMRETAARDYESIKVRK